MVKYLGHRYIFFGFLSASHLQLQILARDTILAASFQKVFIKLTKQH
jgi:hypothetical protein